MRWTIDYGDGQRPVALPHQWGTDVDVRWEGPAVYACMVEHSGQEALLFEGVSYEAKVFLNEELVCVHKGAWDAFLVQLPGTGHTSVRVEVTKNGGDTYPVATVLSGFYPYVFHTFGGIFRPVRLVPKELSLEHGPAAPRVKATGSRLTLDGEPWSMQGVLTWGWPVLSPTADDIVTFVGRLRRLGFNTVKFCLWLPDHRVLEALSDAGLCAWIELPLWMPGPELEFEKAISECERIVRQYRHHPCIVAWSCGCELGATLSSDQRKALVTLVGNLTGATLIVDDSGGAEMYGGNLEQHATFADYHPYCDLTFYAPVLESLRNGCRSDLPILLGETCDHDCYRALGAWLGEEVIETDPKRPWIVRKFASPRPYWASSLPELNDKGVRWQFDLPDVLDKGATPGGEDELVHASASKSRFVRQRMFDAAWAIPELGGLVVTGAYDTPISTSGVLEEGRAATMAEVRMFLVPFRRPPWVNGGNRPGWLDTQSYFVGENRIQIGIRTARTILSRLVVCLDGETVVEEEICCHAETPEIVAKVNVLLTEGRHVLTAEFAGDTRSWILLATAPLDHTDWLDAATSDPNNRLPAKHGAGVLLTTNPEESRDAVITFLGLEHAAAVVPAPFWRECVSTGPLWREEWEYLFGVGPDCVLDAKWVESNMRGADWLMTRVDTRTYGKAPYVVRKGNQIVTTLRPWGGLGSQPFGLKENPSGHKLIRDLLELLRREW